jgi:hypothetical protein
VSSLSLSYTGHTHWLTCRLNWSTATQS